MSVEDTFAGLYELKRQGHKRARRRYERQQRTQDAFKLGTWAVGKINKYFGNKVEDWATNEDNLARLAKYKTDLLRNENIVTEYQESLKHAGGTLGYLTDQRSKYLMDDATSEYGEKMAHLKPEELNAYIQNEASAWAEMNQHVFDKRYEAASNMPTYEEFEAAIEDEYEGPENLAEWFGDKIDGFFRGKTPQTIREENAEGVRARRAEEAAFSMGAYDSALKHGYDVNSAEKISEAVASGVIARKDRKLLEEGTIFEDIKRGDGGVATLKYITKKWQLFDGTEVIENIPDITDLNTKQYVEMMAASRGIEVPDFNDPDYNPYNEPTTITVSGTETTDRWGVNIIEYKHEVRSELFGNLLDTFSTFEYQVPEGETETIGAIQDNEIITISNIFSDISSRVMYTDTTDQERTYQGILASYAGQFTPEGVEPTADQINERIDGLHKSVAMRTRMLANKLEPHGGKAQLDDYDKYYADIAKLVVVSELESLAARETSDGVYGHRKGWTANSEGYEVDILASFLSLEQTKGSQVTLEPEFMENLLNEIDITRIPYLSIAHQRSLLRRMVGAETVQSLFTEGALDEEIPDPAQRFKVLNIIKELDIAVSQWAAFDQRQRARPSADPWTSSDPSSRRRIPSRTN